LWVDDLNSVDKPYTENYFRQLVVAVQPTPAFPGGQGKLEDYGARALVRETGLASTKWRAFLVWNMNSMTKQ
jgi:hypothetical protein